MTDTPAALRLAREAQRSFDEMTDRFGARIHRASCWRTTYFGAAYATRIKAAIVELREAIAEAEQHPEIGPTALAALPLSDDGLETTPEERGRLLQIAEAALRGGGDRFNIMAETMSPLLRDFDRQVATIAALTARVGKLEGRGKTTRRRK